MFQRKLTPFALLPLVALLALLYTAFFLLPAMSSSKVLLAVDFEVSKGRMSKCFKHVFVFLYLCVYRYLGECKGCSSENSLSNKLPRLVLEAG